MNYWLLKSEPTSFGIDKLAKCSKQTTHWDGVRNFQARNMLRDEIKKGDLAFFYHSNCTPPGIVGIVKIVKSGYPDPSAFDPESKYYDPTASPDKPRWFMVDIQLEKKFNAIISLEELKQHPCLHEMQVARKGNRLSVSAVTEKEWKFILKLAD